MKGFGYPFQASSISPAYNRNAHIPIAGKCFNQKIHDTSLHFDHVVSHFSGHFLSEAMAAMADRDLSAFMGRMDKLCQRLNDWKSQTPHTQPAHPSGRSQSGQLSHLSQRSQALSPGASHRSESGSLARSLMTLRSATETSRRWNTSRPTDTVEGGTAGTAGTVEVTRESPLKPSTRSRPSRSPSKSLVSILPHSATDWLNDAKLRREEVKAEVDAFKPTRRIEGPCDGRASHGKGTSEPFDVKTDWQRSRNKLMDGSPSRRRRVESKSPKRTPRSALSPSSRTSHGMDPLSSDPFHMDRPSEVKFSAMDPDRKGSKDSQATINSSFESRISALQQKASGLPRQIETCHEKDCECNNFCLESKVVLCCAMFTWTYSECEGCWLRRLVFLSLLAVHDPIWPIQPIHVKRVETTKDSR